MMTKSLLSQLGGALRRRRQGLSNRRRPRPDRAARPAALLEHLEPRVLLSAHIFTVTTHLDVVDADDGVISLREAITAANNNGNEGELDVINFNIQDGELVIVVNPAANGGLNLPTINQRVKIDGSSQPGIVIDGTGLGGNGLFINSPVLNSEINGLTIKGFNTGIWVAGDRNVVVGNHVLGATTTGIAVAGLSTNAASDNIIGVPGNGNVIENSGTGIDISLATATAGGMNIGTRVQGNTILNSSVRGLVATANVSGLTLGGSGVGEGNTIIGSVFDGVSLSSPLNAVVQGNWIELAGTVGLTVAGPASGTLLIGGSNPGEGNTIVNNGTALTDHGVSVVAGQRVSIRGNSIHGNAGLGINLVGGVENAFRVTANDAGDTDTGANNLQNFPVITFAGSDEVSNTEVQGTIDTQPGVYDLDFYSVAAPDASGHGEGAVYLGSGQVTVVSGVTAFSATLTTPVPVGHIVTATATDANGNTSEFSVSDAGVNPSVVVVSLNAPPAITMLALDATEIDENDTVELTVTFTDDNAGDEHTIAINWGDGTSESVTVPVGARAFVITHPYLDDEPSGVPTAVYTIEVVVDDGTIASAPATVQVTVNNVAPTADPIVGASTGVVFDTVTFSGSFTDPGTLDTHTLEWEIRDGANIVVASGAGSSIDFTPATADTFTVSFTVTDDDTGTDTVSTTYSAAHAAVQTDPVYGGQTLFVTGTDDADDIVIRKGSATGTIRVTIAVRDGDVFYDVTFGPGIDRVVVHARDGDDKVKVNSTVGTVPIELYGGGGDNWLGGGNGPNIIVGGDGDDLIAGGSSRDLLIGGLGVDRILGHQGDDILVGGVTLYDNDRAALKAIMDEWTRTDLGYLARVANLQNGTGLNGAVVLNSTTVFSDGVANSLMGLAGDDYFLASDDDKTDQKPWEVLEEPELDFVDQDAE